MKASKKILEVVNDVQNELNKIDKVLGTKGYDSQMHHDIRKQTHQQLVKVTGLWLDAIKKEIKIV